MSSNHDLRESSQPEENALLVPLPPAHMLSLARRRLYRFSPHDADHILVEELEKKILMQQPVSPETLRSVERYLAELAKGEAGTLDTESLARVEGITLSECIEQRRTFDATFHTLHMPQKAVFIIGSPRSGTTYLYNLLAFQNVFAYPTTISHHKWSLYNLHHLGSRRHFQVLGQSALREDSKYMRLLADVIIPDEAEHIFNRAIPAYTTLRTHEYILTRPELRDPQLFLDVVSKHVQAFDSPFFLSKSPFHTFRIEALCQLFGTSAYFIHIHRNGYAASESISANGFKYFLPDDPSDDPDLFWGRHIEEVLRHQGKLQMMEIAFEKVAADPGSSLQALFSWLHLDQVPQVFDSRYRGENRRENRGPRERIERYNVMLGYGRMRGDG